MSDQTDYQEATAPVLDSNEILHGGYFASRDAGPSAHSLQSEAGPADSLQSKSSKDEKPTHYKVICISMYTKDLKRLDAMVDSLKARGLTKANRSALIRYALGEVDLDSVPQGI